MVGENFIHPVKEFTVENDGGIVVLEFDIKESTAEYPGGGRRGMRFACAYHNL